MRGSKEHGKHSGSTNVVGHSPRQISREIVGTEFTLRTEKYIRHCALDHPCDGLPLGLINKNV